MYTDVSWAKAPHEGADDGKVRVYLCVQGTTPVSVSGQRWEIKLFKTLREAVRVAETLRGQAEFYGAAFAIVKRAGGEFVVAYANASMLVGWPGDDGWVVWGGQVLCGALMRLETESGWGLTPGANWTAGRGDTEGYYPELHCTSTEARRWPDVHTLEASRA